MEHNLPVILSGCKQGIPAWQKVLYEQYYGYVYTICLRYAPTKEDAIEILNDGFVKVFKGVVKFNFPGDESALVPAFLGWLKTIVIHTGINYNKTLTRRILWDSYNSEVETVPAAYHHPLESMAYEELVKLIQKLSPAYRLVFTLFVIEGWTHEEIAYATGTSISTSKTNLLKARKQLRKMLQLSHGEEISRYER